MSAILTRLFLGQYLLPRLGMMRASLQLRALLLMLGLVAPAFLFATDCAGPPALQSEVHSKPTAQGFSRLGQWFDARHKFNCAAESYRSALKLNPNSARTLELLATSLSSLGDLQAAAESLRHSIDLSPSVVSSRVKRARILEQLKRSDEAKSEWQAALKLAPASVDALDGMSRYLIAEGDYGGAIALLRPAPATATSEILTLDLAQAYGKSGMLEDAETILKKMAASHPSSYPLTYALVTVLASKRYYSEAAAVTERFAAAYPQNFDAQRLHLRVLITAQDTIHASPVAHRLLQSHPNDDYVLFANGWLELKSGHFSEAKNYLQQSVALNPDSSAAHFDLGLALAKLNESQEAKQEFEKVIAIGDPPPEAHFELAKILKTLGETEESERHMALFREAKDTESQQSLKNAVIKKAEQELTAGNSQNAVKLYREALAFNPNDALLNYKLSVALNGTGDTAGERAALEKAIQIDPDMAIAHNQLGYLDSRDGDPSAAEEHFRHAVRAAPAFTDAWVNLAATLAMQSRFAEAESAVASALQLEPKNAQALQLKQELAASREQRK